MRPKIRKGLAEFLKIWLFLSIFLLKESFPHAAYAVTTLNKCAVDPVCVETIGVEIGANVAAPTSTGLGQATIAATSGSTGTANAVVTSVGRVGVIVGSVGGGYAIWHYWSQANNKQAQNQAQEKYCQVNPTDSVCHGFHFEGQGQYQDCYPDGLHWEFTGYGSSYSYQTIFNGNPPHGANCDWDLIYIDGQLFTAFKPNTWTAQELQQTPWKDWPQSKRDAAVSLLEPSDWQNLVSSMPQGGLLDPGDTLDANKIVIPGQETDDPNTPEDDRPLRILPGIYTMPGNPDFDDDGLPDTTDPDDDNDGVPDSSDLDPHNSNIPSPPTSASGGSSGSGEPGGSGDPQDPDSSAQPSPLNSNSVVIDSQVSIALDKAARGEPLSVAEQSAVNWVARKRSTGTEIRETNTTVREVKTKNENYQPFQKVPVTVDPSSPEYQAVIQELENNYVGGVPPKGQNDRSIVADTFFAESEEGVTPNFATQDTKVYNNLAKIAGIDPARTGQGVHQAYPNGFGVTVSGKTIHVIPLPKN
ncbi:hypothetical protein NUACC26_016630 [Scytonema sp. NUACC26]